MKGKSGKYKGVSETQKHAYSLFKEYLLQEPVLKLPYLMKLFVLRTDTTGFGVAAVLLHENKGKLYPVGCNCTQLDQLDRSVGWRS